MSAGAIAAGIAVTGGAPDPARPSNEWSLIIAGATDGYLSPCGCTYPMTGGIRRRATAIKGAAASGHAVYIDTGGLAVVPGPQSQLKAETMAQSLAKMDAAAVALTGGDIRLGSSSLQAELGLAKGRVVSTTLSTSSLEGVVPTVERGPFLIGATTANTEAILAVHGRSDVDAARFLVSEAERAGKIPVLMLDAGHIDAVRVAKAVPSLAVIAYRQTGWPDNHLEKVGKVALVTPGERGKAIIQLDFQGSAVATYRTMRLGPQYTDDPAISRYFKTYLQRVDQANLLDALPRLPSDPFVGSAACGKCHAGAEKVWQHSGHFHAYETLEKQGQARDPDCVTCHVVGVDRVGGFQSRLLTPQLSSVGCESCHGAGAGHSASPKTIHFKKVVNATCVSCHSAEQSPGFDFVKYWQKIAHK